MTAPARARRPVLVRARVVALAAVLAATGFAVEASPVPLPVPESLAPASALALACADGPSFEGWLTNSTSAHPVIDRSSTGDVYGYLANVVDDWSCTAFYRYDGLLWARNAEGTRGNFAWGTLINSTSVACNWVIGSTDYLKANGTNDCPDSDAEYAHLFGLDDTGPGDLLETTFRSDPSPDEAGDFLFIHSDCEAYYGSAPQKWDRTIDPALTGTRPGGSLCDPYSLDGTNTTQAIVVDATPPTLSFGVPAGASGTITGTSTTGYTVTFDATDNVADFGTTHPWALQRQVARNTGGGTCDAFANDPGTDGLLTGTTDVTGQSSAQTLAVGHCYRWILSASDMNGNTATPVTSASVIVDTVAPYGYFLAAQPAIGSPGTITRNTTGYTVAWVEIDRESGIATRSLQRQRVASSSATCGGTFSNDAAPVTTASPSAQTLASGYCYRWVQTLTDAAGRSYAATSGTIYVDTTSPMATFTAPAEREVSYQGATSLNVTWTETPGSGSITARSLQRQRATGTLGDPGGLTWAPDGAPDTGASPRSSGTLAEGLYRWEQTLTNSASKTGASDSGWLVVDTSAPAGSISYPEANRPLGGTVTITGSATDPGSFMEYQLEYGAGTSPSSWTAIGTFTSPVAGGDLATWATAGLTGVYTLRLTVREHASAATSVTTRTVVLENTGRGTEAYHTRLPFELGGGWALDVGVANGEARLSRDLFTIPSYGPAQALSLTYSSADPGTAGRFGVGWSSNLTQYLTFEIANQVTTWHRADGGQVPFGLVGSAWTPPRGHFETLAAGTGADAGRYVLTTPDQTHLVFEGSGAGRLLRIDNRFGKSLSLAWNTSSATATDASGRATTITIDAGNARITAVADSAGRTWTFGYTGTGASSDLTCITDPAAKVTRLTYSGHALTTVSRGGATCGANGSATWTIGYTAGKATSVRDPILAHGDLLTYAAGSTTAREVVDDGATPGYADTVYTFDTTPPVAGRGVVADVTDALGTTTHRTYDPDANLLTEAVPTQDDGTANTAFEYDARGNVTRETRDVREGAVVVTVSTYNATNDLLTRTDADNDDAVRTVTRYTYDAAGHLVTENRNCTSSGTTVPAQGQGGSCTGAGTQDASTNVVTSYAYTAGDQLAFEQDPLGRVTRHVYDTHGNETQVIANCTTSGTTPPSPFSSCTGGGTHDAQTNVTSGSAYLASDTDGKAGLATSTTDALGRTTAYDYDALGRQKTEVLPGDTSIPVLTRSTTYDEYGNVLTEAESWTPAGGTLQTRTTAHAYDAATRETQVTDPWTTSTVTTYDAAGDAVQTDVSGPGQVGLVRTLRTFDLLHRPTEEQLASPEDPALLRSYTTLGAVRTTEQPSGVTTTQITDFRGLATSETVDTGGVAPLETVRTYDLLGNELTVDDPDPDTDPDTTSTYDRLGRLLTTTTGGQTTSYTYDRAGNQLTVTDPAGIVTTTSYDPLDRATVVVTNDVGSPTLPSEDVTTRTWYDAAGNAIAVQDPRGITTRTILNARDQAASTIANCTDTGTTPTANPPACTGAGSHTDGANVVAELTYDGQGNVTRTIAAVGRPAQATSETAYDAAGRAQASRDAMGTITRHVYNTAGQLTDSYVNCTTSGTVIPTDWANCTGGGTANGTFNLRTRYTYDDHGQRATVVHPNGRVTAYRYDDDDRLAMTIENYVDGNPGTTDDLTTETFYDAYGRAAAVRTPTANGSTTIVTRTIYNPDGTVGSEIRNCTDSGTTPPADPGACSGAGTTDAQTNVITSYTYDARGNRVQVEAPDPSATTGMSTATVRTQYAFDDANRLCRVVENATGSTDLQTLADPCADATQTPGTATTNVSTRYTYDAVGNIATMIDAAGNTTTYGYDAAGHPLGRTDALGGQLIWRYDDAGNRTSQRNRTDPVPAYSVTWTHDPFGRILTRTADSITTTYTYDANGNQLTATTGTQAITATYDRLGRVLTIDDEDAGTTPDTTYTYSLTTPSWTDPSGAYTVALDKFDRPTALDDPVNAGAANFTWAYRADGQPSSQGGPNGNTTAFLYDALGQLTSKDTTAPGPVNRALYDWTYNRAGQVLSETETITGGSSNGTVSYAYDPLGQLSGSTLAGTATAYGWDATTNRTSVQVGGGPAATTAFDAANRPTTGSNPSVTYASDADGRLTARPGQALVSDRLGRLTAVRDASGTVTLAAYSYDPLDRLRTVDYGGGSRIRFRYLGTTTSAVQWLDDVTGTVTRHLATGWGGERLADWTPAGVSTLRVYGTNAHHDVTWLASNTGTVGQSLRYDPWGTPRTTPPAGYAPFRFQGSWHDTTTDLAWVVSRWYAPSLGRFLSEDTLLGEPADPPSRHLYAYGQGEPVGRWDPDGRFWYLSRPGDTWGDMAARKLLERSNWGMIFNANRSKRWARPASWGCCGSYFINSRIAIPGGRCVWIPWGWATTRPSPRNNPNCQGKPLPESYQSFRRLVGTRDWNWANVGLDRIGGVPNGLLNLNPEKLRVLTFEWTHRLHQSEWASDEIESHVARANGAAQWVVGHAITRGRRISSPIANIREYCGNSMLPDAIRGLPEAFTLGQYIFYRPGSCPDGTGIGGRDALVLRSHEYIHVLQYEMIGSRLMIDYLDYAVGQGYEGYPDNPYEAIAYIWSAWTRAYGEPSWRYYWPNGG